MSVYKMVEVVGTSGTSITDAVESAVRRASSTLEDVSWFEVKEIRGRLADGKIEEYQCKIDIGFLLHPPEERGATRKRAKEPRADPKAAAKGGERSRGILGRAQREAPRKR